MRIGFSPLLVLATVATAAVLFGCGTAPASQDTEGRVRASAGQRPSRPSMAETMEAPVEVGYEVGLHAPEFAMSLLDGTGVTASGLSAEGKPVFLYFHATY